MVTSRETLQILLVVISAEATARHSVESVIRGQKGPASTMQTIKARATLSAIFLEPVVSSAVWLSILLALAADLNAVNDLSMHPNWPNAFLGGFE
jgi:hypothetical protein